MTAILIPQRRPTFLLSPTTERQGIRYGWPVRNKSPTRHLRHSAVNGQSAVITVNEGHIAAYDLPTGDQLWECEWPGHSNSDASCSQPHLLDDEQTVYFQRVRHWIGSLFAYKHRWHAWSIEPIWRQSNLLKTKFTNVAIYNGYAYGLSDGILECVQLFSGNTHVEARDATDRDSFFGYR